MRRKKEKKELGMYYYEKDYIMRLIHGIAQVLARLLLGKQMEQEGEIASALSREAAKKDETLKKRIDAGQINEAEELLFDLLENEPWEDKQKAALALSFYDHVNEKEDAFLEKANFSREEIIEGLEDAMKTVNMEIPEYLRI